LHCAHLLPATFQVLSLATQGSKCIAVAERMESREEAQPSHLIFCLLHWMERASAEEHLGLLVYLAQTMLAATTLGNWNVQTSC
jgi:hypothetical protein